jgi:uncharacterized membrane protein YdjX (TVP38/TMEM64 family)
MPATAIKSRSARRSLWGWTVAIIGLIAIVGLVWSFGLKNLHDRANQWNATLVILALLILPVLGAPVSVLFIVAGARFGPLGGLAVTAVSIAFHLVFSWWLAHGWLRAPFDHLFKKLGFERPKLRGSDHALLCSLVALVPGPPYAAKNYLLALSGAPFRTFFLASLPAHVFTASGGVLFGDFSGNLTPAKTAFLVVYVLLIIGLGRYGLHRLRKHQRQPAH